MKTLISISVFTVAVALLSAGCAVNELPAYRSRIQAVHLAPSVAGPAQLTFVSPEVLDSSNPDDVALAVMESRVRERLSQRLTELGHPDLVEGTFDAALRDSFETQLPWQVVEPTEIYDAVFSVRVERYGVSVDAAGLAVLYFETTVQGRFVENGAVIYENRVQSEVPLTEMYHGQDPVSEAVARTMNLLALDELSAAELQNQILWGADRAAQDLVNELVDDAWD